MTPQHTLNLLRSLFVAFTTYIGWQTGEVVLGHDWAGGLAGAAFGLAIVLADRLLKGVSLRLFSSATFGLLIGTIFARLLLASDVLRGVREELRWVLGLLTYATSAYLATMLALRSNRQDFSLIIPYVRFRQASTPEAPLVLDSNIIIDGRLPELCATGFLSTNLIVPQFILEELQKLADSGDGLKRERGRRALAQLEELQRHPTLTISIHEGDLPEAGPADAKLVQLARLLDARLLTNDTNLAAIARLQSVAVLSLHDLTRALKVSLNPGDRMELTLVKEGREPHQVVGYLPDGTMIVVNHARALLGQTVPVTISSHLQTAAGRLFFAERA